MVTSFRNLRMLFGSVFAGQRVFLKKNWDRQKVPKLQLFLLFPLHRKSGGFDEKMSECQSSTICVCETEKWIKTFVRGRVETENRLNTHISRMFS